MRKYPVFWAMRPIFYYTFSKCKVKSRWVFLTPQGPLDMQLFFNYSSGTPQLTAESKAEFAHQTPSLPENTRFSVTPSSYLSSQSACFQSWTWASGSSPFWTCSSSQPHAYGDGVWPRLRLSSWTCPQSTGRILGWSVAYTSPNDLP